MGVMTSPPLTPDCRLKTLELFDNGTFQHPSHIVNEDP